MSRIRKADLLFEKMPENYDEESLSLRETIYNEVLSQTEGQPQCVRIALSFGRFLKEKPIILHDYDLLAGQLQHYKMSSSMPILYDDRGYDLRNFPTSHRRPDTARILRKCKEEALRRNEDPLDMESLSDDIRCGLITLQPYGHTIAGFDRVARLGFDGIREQIRQRESQGDLDEEEKAQLKAMDLTAEASSVYIERYAKAAEKLLSAQNDPDNTADLARIAESCRRIAHEPAQTFFDALQLTVILQELTVIETSSGSMSFGRMDQLFGPYYLEEVKNGTINEEEAQLLIHAWRMKVAGLVQAFQNVTIGGCDEKGNFAGNPVTLMFLRSAMDYRFDQPLLSMRCTKEMPDEYWETAMKLISLGDGFPALHNDDVIIDALIRSGVSEKDAWNYGIVGCVEPAISGKEYSNTEEIRISWPKLLEIMLNGGVCPLTKVQIPLKTVKGINTIKSAEELTEWFRDELVHAIQRIGNRCTLVDRYYGRVFPSPFLSMTLEGCTETASDASGAKGPVYRFSTINHCGMSNVTDSLLAISTIVFEKKMESLPSLLKILASDFADREDLCQYMKRRCPHFGNESEESEALMRDLTDTAAKAVSALRNGRGFPYRSGMYSVSSHAVFGLFTGATPDGRHRGESLANGLSPVQGTDTKGPLAVTDAVTALDHRKFGNGMVLDLKFLPSLLNTPAKRQKLRYLTETYFENGGMELQFNVVDRATLLAAQKNPDQYRNLIVRVSGFSAYFTALFKPLQDEIIARTENGGF